ncbi:unnamed protein product [Didymodactylos carnosus]|uniref:Uncharacterized protein n=1 Tax=Didymodactylos carnosus TaxID=1234261 RepID=A0A8S2F1S0_9BILA|nr:unnamed protein product [Didymodactylos carnosus]CAF4180536.1 unnamed protein product [Didymodactylos carnosus]
MLNVNGDIYISDVGRVQKWISTRNEFIPVMSINSSCSGVFVDIIDNLYCSMTRYHQVLKRSLNDSESASISAAAGTGSKGFAATKAMEIHNI